MRIIEVRSIPWHKTIVLFIMAACVAWLCSCSNVQDPSDSGQSVKKTSGIKSAAMNAASDEKWTFLLYIAADVAGTIDPFEYYAAQLHSGDNLNVLIFDDRIGETAKIWFIDENHNAVLREDVGEVNMGSASTLAYFLDYAKTNCPADRYIISFYGHGGAWSGACPDTDPFDCISKKTIRGCLCLLKSME